jgi:hypothetical protein
METPDTPLLINMDETGVPFYLYSETTIDTVGVKHVHYRTANSEDVKCTAVLTIANDGTKLMPLAIFSGMGTYLIKGLKADNCYFIFSGVQNRCNLNVELMKYWIEKVYKPFYEERCKEDYPLLILDNYSPHKILPSTFPHLFLPPNTTSQLQPLDVYVNKPFKSKIKTYWEEWMSQNYNTTKNGYYKRADRNLMLNWIERAWASIDSE